MADEHNVIEIILRARDETSAAFASLAAKMGLQKEAARALARDNENLRESYKNLAADAERVDTSFNKLQQSYGKNQIALGKNVTLTKEIADAHIRVEQAANRAAAATDRQTHTVAQQAVAEHELEAATKALSEEIKKQITANDQLSKSQKDRARVQAELHTQSVRETAEQIGLDNKRRKSLEDDLALLKKIDRDEATVAAARQRRREEDLAWIKRQEQAEAAAARTRAAASAKEARDEDIVARARHQRRQDDLADIQRIERDRAAVARAEKARADAEVSDAKRVTKEMENYEKAVKAAAQARRDLVKERLTTVEKMKLDVDFKGALLQAEIAKKEIGRLVSHIDANLDLDDARFYEAIPGIMAAKELIGRPVHINIDTDVGAAVAKLGALEAAEKSVSDQGSGMFSGLSKAFADMDTSVAGFDNVLRGAATFAIAGFLQPLIVLAGAAAGALTALASAALYAGGALAGGLAAGAAQAIPVLGVVALAVYRLMAVFQAAQQAQLVQQQQTYRGATAHQTAARAANTYANSINAVLTAERNLSKARLQARRDLQDMVLAERAAELQAKASSLAQQDAAKQLAVAISSGGDVQQAQLGVQQANLGTARANVGLSRARQDLATGQRQGVAGAPGVVAASQALEQAKRGTDQAAAAADLAANKITAATGKLDFLLGRMSPAERQLFGIVQRFQEVFRKAAEQITEPIIRATGTILNRLIGIFKDPRIVGAMRGLAGTMAREGVKLFSAFTDKKSIDTFIGFINEAKTNLGPLTDILINVGKIFLSIAQAASPVLKTLLGFFDQVTGKWSKFLDTPKGKSTLKQFFTEGTDALLAFLNLGGAIVKLFLAIAGPGGGAKTGIDLLVGATGGINKLADNINKGGKAAQFLHEMFRITKEVIKDLAPLFTSIGNELGKTFSEKGRSSLKGFIDLLAKVLVPALGTFIRDIGKGAAALGVFLDKHPQLAKVAATLLGIGLAAGLVWKSISLLFGPLSFVIKMFERFPALKKAIGELIASFGEMLDVLEVVGLSLSDLILPVALVVGITILLAKFGLLKPIMNAIKDGFDKIVKIAGPPFRDLISQVGRLFDAFGKGKGAFAIIRPLLSFLVNQVLIREIKALATIIGNVLGGAFKILAGAIGLITDLLTGKWSKAWADVKKIFSGLAQMATAGIRGLLAAFGDLPKKVLHFFIRMIDSILNFLGISSPSKKFHGIGIELVNGLINGLAGIGGKVLGVITGGFRLVFNFFRGLPGRLKDLAGKAVDAVVGVFGGLGKKAIDAAVGIGTTVFNFGKALTKAIAQLIDKAIPNSIHMPDPLPNIDLPNNPLKDLGFYQHGGAVGQGFGGGDRIPALLEEGEHIFSKDEVQAIGGHGVLLALRRALGGGGQGGRGRFAVGGVATGTAKPGMNALLGVVQIQAEEGIKQLVKFSDDFRHIWNQMWNNVQHGANAGSNAVIEQFTRLRDQCNKLINQLANHITSQFDWVKNRAINDSRQLVNQVTQSINNLENVVFKGMSYIGNTTNDALKSFSAKPVQLSISAPGKAGGGWIGNRGERGRDMIATLLGRGEAVLNWGHQRLVDPALRAFYGFGLGEMFDRTEGFHAGGDTGGFAKGGFSHYDRLIQAANKVSAQNFPYVWGGGHTQPAQFGPFDCSGAVSYVTQQAGYKVPTSTSGNMASWGFPAGPNGATIFYNPVHTFMRIGSRYFGTSGFARPNGGAGWFDQTPGASYLSGFKTIHLPNLGADAPFMLANGMDGVQRVVVKGVGALKNLAQAILDKARGAANDYIGQQQSTLMPGFGQFGDTGKAVFGGGSPVAARKWTAEAMRLAGVSGPLWMNMLLRQESRESSFDPNSINRTDINAQRGDPSIGIMQTIGATFRAYMLPGHGNIRNPVDNIAAAIRYIIATYGHGNADVGAQVMWNRGGGAYGRGGFVGSYDVGGELPGAPGQPIPIIAHAKEWVVNQAQQSKIARWLGTSRDQLKGALGFTGGPHSFAGGGEPLPITFGAKVTAKDLQLSNLVDLLGEISPGSFRNYMTLVRRVNTALRKFGDKVGDFFKGVNTLTEQDGIFDQLSAAIDARLAQIQTGLDLARTGLRRVRTRAGATVLRRATPLTETRADQREYDIANANVTALGRERSALRADLQKTNQRIAKLREGGIGKSERDHYQQLLGARNKFLIDLDAADAKIATARADRFDKATTLFQAQLTQALKPSVNDLALADKRSRIASTLGNTDAVARASDLQIKALKDQQDILQQQYTAAARKAKRDPRWQSIADDLLSQLRDATASVVEAQAQALQNQIDVVNNRAGRSQAAIDIRNRLIDVQERMGNPVGAAQARLGTLQATGGLLGTQVAGLQGALAVARQEKNNALIDSLNDQIADLNTQIVENTAAMSDQTVAVRQATLDQIQGRTTFQTGALGGLGSLLQTIATNLNVDTSGGQTTILQQTGAVLQQGFDSLAKQLFDFGGLGINVQGLSGMGFVEAISRLNFDAIESGMTEAQKSQFEALIQALIDSQNAIAQNTGQLQDLTGTLGKAQGFSSTAWQWFRMAVFTGAGQLMPQYQIPSMQSGGYVTRQGIFNLHAGEFVVNPSNPSQRGTGGSGDINVTVHESGPETDYTYLANRIAFATRTPST